MPANSTKSFERLLAEPREVGPYVLRLFVAGMTERSAEAVRTVKAVCDEHLHGRYELEVINIYDRPDLVKEEQIIAVPTLVKKFPMPLRRLIGNLSSKERVLRGLDLRRAADGSPS